MRFFIVFVCVGIILVSCKKQEAYKLPEDKMIAIMTDLHIAEAAASVAPGVKDSILSVYESQIFRNHNIDKNVFKESLKQYHKEPAVIERMYKKIIERLDAKDKE